MEEIKKSIRLKKSLEQWEHIEIESYLQLDKLLSGKLFYFVSLPILG
jgi:hypothetical protein